MKEVTIESLIDQINSAAKTHFNGEFCIQRYEDTYVAYFGGSSLTSDNPVIGYDLRSVLDELIRREMTHMMTNLA